MAVLVFDIETIHDLKAARRVLKMPDADDDTMREAINTSALVNDRGFIKPALHQVVCIGVLTVDKATEGWKIERQRTLCADEFDEAELIGGFLNHMRAVQYPQLVTFNGGGFDLPVLCYRAMMHRIRAPQLFERRYFYRYGEDHLDLCDALSCFGASTRMKLDELARTFGLPGKPDGVDGSQVENLARAGRWDELAEYCAADVLDTYRIWLRYELLRGHLTAEQFDWSDAQAADYVGRTNWPPSSPPPSRRHNEAQVDPVSDVNPASRLQENGNRTKAPAPTPNVGDLIPPVAFDHFGCVPPFLTV